MAENDESSNVQLTEKENDTTPDTSPVNNVEIAANTDNEDSDTVNQVQEQNDIDTATTDTQQETDTAGQNSEDHTQERGDSASNDETPTGTRQKVQIKLTTPTDKITVLLKPAGATPALTKAKWNVTRDKTIGSIAKFVKKPLKMETHQTLFMYVKQTFAPAADVEMGKLYDCFGSDGQLVLHYCMTEAWG